MTSYYSGCVHIKDILSKNTTALKININFQKMAIPNSLANY